MADFIWKPSAAYVDDANVTRFMRAHGIADPRELWKRSVADIRWFWDAAVRHVGVAWYRPYDQVLDDSKGIEWSRWFVGGRTNIVLNCIDRHIAAGRGERLAIIGEADDGAVRRITYTELSAEVGRLAALMRELGIAPGDRVGIYMPMVPEVAVAMFACFKVGAVAIPIFSGFGAEALATRLDDSGARLLLTADGSFRRGKPVRIKDAADEAAARVPSLEHVVVLRRAGLDVAWTTGRDLWWDEALADRPIDVPTEELDAEAPALILYTSGTTGKPKGTVHTHAGCLAQMGKELFYAFDLKGETDVFFWVTDIGWMMGPWEMIGVQLQGGTYVLLEGVPNHPTPARLWEMVERHGVTTLGISPTAIRVLKAAGDEWVERHDLSRLRLLGSTGEPWDPDSYSWFFRKVGGGRCPVINISGGTEIVGCLLSPLPVTPLKPCSLGIQALGMDVDVFDEAGRPIVGGIGHLVCKQPAPSMTKGFWNDPDRYIKTYFSRWSGVWYHGDWAEQDADGLFFLHGRSDDTIKVAGKRTGPAEIESALVEHESVVEAAAIGVPDEIKGEVVVCFVAVAPGVVETEELRDELSGLVVAKLGKTLRPKAIKFVDVLPKTRSGKVLRGMIRRKFLGEDVGDTASVENPEAVDRIGSAR
jgi:acetyl-CoA synthetase